MESASTTAIPNEASLSMFCTQQETWVDFIPTIHIEESLTLLNGHTIGRWQAGIPTSVPLWLARHLQTKSLGTISSNGSMEDENDKRKHWMRVEPLKQILQYEKENETLWINEDEEEEHVGRVRGSASDRPFLPERYWELSRCYSTADNAAAVFTLLQDIWDKRLDKLRTQFQKVYRNEETLSAVNVTGIGTAELALMRRVIAQSLTQKAALQRFPKQQPQQQQQQNRATAVTATKTDAILQPDVARPVRGRAPIRRFRRNPCTTPA